MALSSSASSLLRRLLSSAAAAASSKPTSSFTPRAAFSFSSPSSPLFGGDADDGEIKNVPPLTAPKLFVSGLSRLTTDDKLKNAFSPFGQLLEAKVITDRTSGRSKGFGFVTFATIEEAEKARQGMNAKFLDGWVIFVDPATPRERKPAPRPDMETETTSSGFRTNKTVGWCG